MSVISDQIHKALIEDANTEDYPPIPRKSISHNPLSGAILHLSNVLSEAQKSFLLKPITPPITPLITSPIMSFHLNEINTKNLELIMNSNKKEIRNWEFGVSNPGMVDLEEIAVAVTKENPFVVIQSFRKKRYIEQVQCGKGKNKRTRDIEKVRTDPVDGQVTILIHNSIVRKGTIISHMLMGKVKESPVPGIYQIVCRTGEVERMVRLTKEIKNASFGEELDEQFVRVMVRRI